MNNLELLSFLRFIYNKKVIVFGTGTGSQRVSPMLPCDVAYYLDNDRAKWDQQFMNAVILNPSILAEEDKDSIVIVVISSFYQEIALQLSSMGFIEHVHFQNGLLLFEDIILSSGNSLAGSNDVNDSKIRMVGCVQNKGKISIDPTAIVFSSSIARFDLPGHTINPCITINKNSMVGCNFIFESTEGSVYVGERTFINNGVNFISRNSIKVGSDVTIGWGCCFYDHDSHSLDWRERALDIQRQRIDYQASGNMVLNKDWTTVKSKPIVIEDKVWIGFDVTILKGVTIGEGAIVGAKSVVREDVEPWTVVAGNPAKAVKRLKPS